VFRSRMIVYLFIAVMLLAVMPAQAASPAPDQGTSPDLAVIMTTYTYQDAAKTTWLGESGPFLNDLGANGKDVSDTLPYCDKAMEGTLYGRNVLLVTTGTTKVPAGECAMNLVMSPWITQTKEIILTGISGFSPRVGGYVDAVGMPVAGEPTMIGDVCVSPVVVNELAFMSMNNQQYWPLNFPNSASVGMGSTKLSDAIYQASLHVTWPTLPDGPKANVLKYFGNANVLRLPKAWYKNCAELTSDIFWHGAMDDLYARDWIAPAISQVFSTTVTSSSVVVSTAMETIGIFAAVQKYNAVNKANVPIALVRSASNYDQPWLGANGKEAVGPAQSIDAGMTSGGGDVFGAQTEYLVVKQYLTESAAAK
jgi:purine nucleoside permease